MFGLPFLLVAALAAYGLYYVLRANQRNKLYLESARQDEPLQLDHLSRPLRRIAEDTRLLRISLEAPIRDIGDLRVGDLHHSAGEDLESFDNMLMTVSRHLVDWVGAVEALPESERNVLADLGLSAKPIRRAIDDEGGAFERRNLWRKGVPPMDARLKTISKELSRFEAALQAQPRLYR